MLRLTLVKIPLLSILFFHSFGACSQGYTTDSSGKTTSFRNAVDLYHHALSPEPSLYEGSEYNYADFYPFVINNGHPFFQSKDFDTGSVFYNNMLFENVPLLFDLVKQLLLVNDPSHIYKIRLNTERIGWFNIFGHTFVRMDADKTNPTALAPGFYDLLYNGNTPLFKKVLKKFDENSSLGEGVYGYVIEADSYFIKQDNQYYRVKNKKSILHLLVNNKKELVQFIRKNKLNFKKDKDNAFKKILAYYDVLQNNNTNNSKAVN